MSYVGGKAKKSSHIIEVLNLPIFDNLDYVEPFVGMGHILRRVVNKRSYFASDYNPLLCALLLGIQKGVKIPPISKKRYEILKAKYNDNSFERAIACFCYSYGGKAWGGYFPEYRSPTRYDNYVKQRINYYDALRENETFKKTEIECWSYLDIHPSQKFIIYCDPPYRGTTGYRVNAARTEDDVFNHDLFWETMRKWSAKNYVFISEYSAPDDFIEISTRVEYLFAHKSVVRRVRSLGGFATAR
jgi:DNA adenine methylase